VLITRAHLVEGTAGAVLLWAFDDPAYADLAADQLVSVLSGPGAGIVWLVGTEVRVRNHERLDW
jgi:hypothetical protein